MSYTQRVHQIDEHAHARTNRTDDARTGKSTTCPSLSKTDDEPWRGPECLSNFAMPATNVVMSNSVVTTCPAIGSSWAAIAYFIF